MNTPRATNPEAESDTAQQASLCPELLAQSDFPPADAVLPLDSPTPSEPTRLNLLLGQLLLRACPCGSKVESCKGCQVCSLCRCAHGHAWTAATVEANFWLLLVLSLGVVLYSMLNATLHRL